MNRVSRLGGSIWRQLRKLLTGGPSRRVGRIQNHFIRGYGVEPDIFNFLKPENFPPGWTASIIEIVAVLSVTTTTAPFTGVVELLDRFLNAGWINNNVELFARTLMETSRAFYGQGWDREAGRLLKIGEIFARRQGRKAIESEFRRELDRRTVRRLRDQPFLPQRGQ